MGLKWLIFLIGPLGLSGMWFRENERANIIKTHMCLKEIGLHLQISIIILHSIVNTFESTYVSNEEINKHALPITVTKIKGGPIFTDVSLQIC